MAEPSVADVVNAAARLGLRPDALIARWVRLRLAGVPFSATSLRRMEFTEADLASLSEPQPQATVSQT